MGKWEKCGGRTGEKETRSMKSRTTKRMTVTSNRVGQWKRGREDKEEREKRQETRKCITAIQQSDMKLCTCFLLQYLRRQHMSLKMHNEPLHPFTVSLSRQIIISCQFNSRIIYLNLEFKYFRRPSFRILHPSMNLKFTDAQKRPLFRSVIYRRSWIWMQNSPKRW
jgi:hypothetical protein